MTNESNSARARRRCVKGDQAQNEPKNGLQDLAENELAKRLKWTS